MIPGTVILSYGPLCYGQAVLAVSQSVLSVEIAVTTNASFRPVAQVTTLEKRVQELETSDFTNFGDILFDLQVEEICQPSGAMCPGATLIPEEWDRQERTADVTHSDKFDLDVS